MIENHLKNAAQFTETDEDPTEEYNVRIKEWADRGLEAGEISEDMHKFATNEGLTDELHMAVPKPNYKTHKPNPNTIRTITVGVSTPVHSLSKLCSDGIQHLASPEVLPQMMKSTKAV